MTDSTEQDLPGTTKPAGEGVSDSELSEQVAEQTSSDLAVEEAFERESDGATTDTEAADGPPA